MSNLKTAQYYKLIERDSIECSLCPNHCVIANGSLGACQVRKNMDGVLYALNYCRPVSVAIDPIEKKPLYHFFPGSTIFSTGPNGCNLKCLFCQNYTISQHFVESQATTIDQLLDAIVSSNTIGVAYTYSEPFVWFETIKELAPRVKERGLMNVLVTNGYIEPEPLMELIPFIDAMNIDIKGMNEEFYQRVCKAKLAPILRNCETVKRSCHLEITNLLIPGENDSEDDILSLFDFIASNLGSDTPLHFSRYFPRYRMHHPQTPEEKLIMAYNCSKERLHFVYLGNIDVLNRANTYCHSCLALLVERQGYRIKITDNLQKYSLTHGICSRCNTTIPIRL